VDSYLGLLFCSTGLHLCSYASTMLFLSLWLCTIVWYLQCYSFCSILPWLFAVFCASNWILCLIFQSLWWMEFWWELRCTFRLLLAI
jgi:hypothetical protein